MEPRPGKVGDFILLEAARVQTFNGRELHLPLFFLRRYTKRAALELPEKRCTFFIGQGVGGNMLRPEFGGVIEGCLPLRQRLPGQRVDEVETDVVESRCACGFEGRYRLGDAVVAVEKFQLVFVKGLHAQAEPVDACVAKSRQLSPVDGRRIRFQRDLRIGRQMEVRADGGDNAGELVGREQRRRAATEIECREALLPPLRLRAGDVNFTQQRVEILRHLFALVGYGKEIAVAAANVTERDVDVDACGHA